jgi:hypothetical protein
VTKMLSYDCTILEFSPIEMRPENSGILFHCWNGRYVRIVKVNLRATLRE